MTPADRLADGLSEPEPVLSMEEAEALAEAAPSDEALAAIAAVEAHELRRAMLQRFRL
ncbi:hypothetical protein [Methylobacterium soli]|uniref:hypothetical protein n=1 Tax=Methylobacterium soli TaxID=553447 RepID=UPI00177DAE1C|nr:hypothetical protein [Methylobacterium soli]GJE45451.1 hypothetical protein AEGHOMDF_4646 [Methylobacterium soli]